MNNQEHFDYYVYLLKAWGRLKKALLDTVTKDNYHDLVDILKYIDNLDMYINWETYDFDKDDNSLSIILDESIVICDYGVSDDKIINVEKVIENWQQFIRIKKLKKILI